MSRIFRISFSILVVFTIVWGVSKAEEILDEVFPMDVEPTVSFSLAGIVKEVTSNKIVLTKAVGVDSGTNIFEIDIISNEQVVETNTYEGLTMADVLVDDKIIVQGFKRDGVFYSRRIISFATRFPDTPGINGVIEPEIADEEILEIVTATTTDELPADLATTTDETASSTEEVLSDENASSTPDQNTSSIEEELITDSATTSEDASITEETNPSGDTQIVEDATSTVSDSSENASAPTDNNSTTTEEEMSSETDDATEEVIDESAETTQEENTDLPADVEEGENASSETVVEESESDSLDNESTETQESSDQAEETTSE